MSKKSGSKKKIRQDFTINDCANALKPVTRLKKASAVIAGDQLWDQVDVNQLDLETTLNIDSTKSVQCEGENNNVTNNNDVYPEIVWYHVSHYIAPEDVGRFARINKSTYAITKHKSFWFKLFKRYCNNHPKLPEYFQIKNDYKMYGLRQRVIRALYYTHNVFIERITNEASQDSKPHSLVKRKCVNLWSEKGTLYCSLYFKFKSIYLKKTVDHGSDFIEALGRIDANPEEDCKVLQVICQSYRDMSPELLGMNLSSVKVGLDQGFSNHKLILGFSTSNHNISRYKNNVLPETYVVIDAAVKILVFDWWHPQYPYFEVLPSNIIRDESLPVLKKDFFSKRSDEE